MQKIEEKKAPLVRGHLKGDLSQMIIYSVGFCGPYLIVD
jgi:hypothetical protein